MVRGSIKKGKLKCWKKLKKGESDFDGTTWKNKKESNLYVNVSDLMADKKAEGYMSAVLRETGFLSAKVKPIKKFPATRKQAFQSAQSYMKEHNTCK